MEAALRPIQGWERTVVRKKHLYNDRSLTWHTSSLTCVEGEMVQGENIHKIISSKEWPDRDFPGSPMAKTPSSQCRGFRFHP